MIFQRIHTALFVAITMMFNTIAAAETTTTTVVTLTAATQASSVTTGSYTLCQFYSSVPGATGGASGTSSLLPPCPSSGITYSYTAISVPTTTLRSSTFGPPDSTSYTLCQFYSSLPAVTPEATSGGTTTMILPGCPSNLVTMTYVLPTSATATVIVTSAPSATLQSATTSAATGTGLVSSFSGLAAPPAAVDKLAIAGIGALVVVVVIL